MQPLLVQEIKKQPPWHVRMREWLLVELLRGLLWGLFWLTVLMAWDGWR